MGTWGEVGDLKILEIGEMRGKPGELIRKAEKVLEREKSPGKKMGGYWGILGNRGVAGGSKLNQEENKKCLR